MAHLTKYNKFFEKKNGLAFFYKNKILNFRGFGYFRFSVFPAILYFPQISFFRKFLLLRTFRFYRNFLTFRFWQVFCVTHFFGAKIQMRDSQVFKPFSGNLRLQES